MVALASERCGSSIQKTVLTYNRPDKLICPGLHSDTQVQKEIGMSGIQRGLDIPISLLQI